MHNGLARFEYFLNQLQTLMSIATGQKNPALWLYRNNARTPLFMLEGLAKLYAELHNEKRFTKIKAQFKLLEDVLGAIDYYDSMAKDLVNFKKVPPNIITYLQGESREKVQSLNEILVEKNWLSLGNNRLVKIHKKLTEADWLKEEDEIKAINDFYGQAIYDISEYVQEKKFHFSNIESDVHELRRKLRWLSIYPQALRGCIQLEKNKTTPAHLKKYATKEITDSPFNKMPDRDTNHRYVLLLEQNYYYALSWMIAELGQLKDSGLRIIAVNEALQQTAGIGNELAYREAYKLIGNNQPKLEALLAQAESICKTYFKEQNLEHLVIGTRSVEEVRYSKDGK
ncbi:MAG: hypothetical protein ABIN67_22390 [Ferruginibacter sp.]